MRKLDYSHLIHNKPDIPKNHSVSHSLYIYVKKNTAGMCDRPTGDWRRPGLRETSSVSHGKHIRLSPVTENTCN